MLVGPLELAFVIQANNTLEYDVPAAIGPTPTTTPTATSTPRATATWTTVPTHTPTPAVTPVPTNTPTPTAVTVMILGHVWADLNQNQIRDANENGIADVKVELFAGSSQVNGAPVLIANAFTDAKGAYFIIGVAPGAYLLTQTDLPGHFSTTENTVIVQASANTPILTRDFGDRPFYRVYVPLTFYNW